MNRRYATARAILLLTTLALLVATFAAAQVTPPTGRRDRSAERRQPTPRMTFEGNARFSASELRSVVAREIESAQGANGSAGDVIDAASSIEQWYVNQGFPDATIRVRMLDAEGSTVSEPSRFDRVVRVVFLVEEGSRFFLGDVRFEGNEAFSDDVLSRYLPRRGSEVLGAGRPLYRPNEVRATAARVARHYRLAGYLRVAVEGPRINRSNRAVDVVYQVREGPRFTIADVALPSMDGVPFEVVQAVRETAPSADITYTERTAADGADRIERVLRGSGYRTDVRYEIALDQSNATVAIRYDYSIPRRAFLGSIRVEQTEATRTRAAIIRNRFPLEPGEPIDAAAIDAGVDTLYRSGLFQLVTTNLVESGAGVMDLVVSVEEANNRYLEVAAGYSSAEQLVGSAEYADRNVFGTGRLWALRAEGGFRGYRVETRIADRFLLGPAGTIRLAVEHALRLREAFADRSTSSTITAELPLAQSLRIGGDVEVSLSRVEDFSRATEQLVRLATVDARLSYDDLDSPLFPTEGAAAGIDAALPFDLGAGTLQSVRLLGWAEAHARPMDRIILSADATAEAILPAGDREIPISQRLYAGGSDSVRSVPEEALSPVDSDGNPIGGLTRLEGTVETRIRVWGDFFFALFYDVGMVANEWLDVPGHGIGVGVRYRLPFGPVRLDFAINPGRRFAAERGWALHFSVGSGT